MPVISAPRHSAAPPADAEVGAAQQTLFLDFQCQGGEIRVASHTGEVGSPQTVRRYEDARVSLVQVEKHAARIEELLGRANRQGRIGNELLAALGQAGQLLYEELFPTRAKQELSNTRAEFLVLGTDDRLVHIPWELAHDGEEFLCRRFSMGRVVSTRQECAAAQRKIGSPLSLLILADPQGNLPSAYREGLALRDLLDRFADRAVVTLKSSPVRTDYVKTRLRDCDILHYAGHADYQADQPAESGLLLTDGKLSARDLRGMSGRRPFPALVFSNACNSGYTREWLPHGEGHPPVYGLANAFLLAGVRHYLGTFWAVPDAPSLFFAQAFYTALIRGAAVGTAVRDARRAFAQEYGEDSIFWASYMLYGDPTVRYVGAKPAVLPQHHPPVEPSTAAVGALRGGAESDGPRSRWVGHTAVGAAAVVVVVLLALLGLHFARAPSAPAPSAAASLAGRERSLEGLLGQLARRAESGAIQPAVERDAWVSRPLSVVLLGIQGNGLAAAERDFLVSRWLQSLQNPPRSTMVERQQLDTLLRELELGSSDLADPAAALRVGRILSANLLITGSVSRDADQWLVSLRGVDTETTAVVVSLSLLRRDAELGSLAEAVGAELRAEIAARYPLQARVLEVTPDTVTLGIGADLGVTQGRRFRVLSETGEPAGELEVVRVAADRAQAIGRAGPMPTVGQRVRESGSADAP